MWTVSLVSKSQSASPTACQPVIQLVSQSISLSVSQSVSQSVPSLCPHLSHLPLSLSPSACQPSSQPFSQWVRQSASESVSQPFSHPHISQPPSLPISLICLSQPSACRPLLPSHSSWRSIFDHYFMNNWHSLIRHRLRIDETCKLCTKRSHPSLRGHNPGCVVGWHSPRGHNPGCVLAWHSPHGHNPRQPTAIPTHTRHLSNVVLKLGHRLQRRPNLKTTMTSMLVYGHW